MKIQRRGAPLIGSAAKWKGVLRSRSVLGLRRLGEGTLLGGIPTPEQADRWLQGHRSLLESVTPEMLEWAREHPEVDFLGPADGPRRTD